MQIRFLAVNDLLDGAVSANTQAITDNVKQELGKSGLDIQNFSSFSNGWQAQWGVSAAKKGDSEADQSPLHLPDLLWLAGIPIMRCSTCSP